MKNTVFKMQIIIKTFKKNFKIKKIYNCQTIRENYNVAALYFYFFSKTIECTNS